MHHAIGSRIELADGGVVDNLAVEQVWSDHEAVGDPLWVAELLARSGGVRRWGGASLEPSGR